tara:strand:+ start:381 stop:548 length:168 start_codon:yes stop_codon:yes gene_type:complete
MKKKLLQEIKESIKNSLKGQTLLVEEAKKDLRAKEEEVTRLQDKLMKINAELTSI